METGTREGLARRWRPRGWWLGVGLSVAAPLSSYALLAHHIARLEDGLSQRTGVPCTIASVEAGLTGTLRLRGVRVGTMFAAEAVEASMSWASMLAGAMHVDEIRVETPKMAISVSATGESDLAQLVARVEGAHPRPTAAPHTGSTTPRRIVVSKGELALTVAGIGSFRAQSVELVPRTDGVRAICGRIKLHAAAPSPACDGAAPGCAPLASLDLELSHAAADLALPRIAVQRLVAVGGVGAMRLGSTEVQLAAVSLARLSPKSAMTAQVTLEDHGVPRPFEVWVETHPAPTVMVRSAHLPLWPLATLAPSWLSTKDAHFSGEISLARGAAIGLSASGRIEGARVDHPVLATVPVELSSDLEVIATVQAGPTTATGRGALDVNAVGTWTLGAAHWTGSLLGHRGATLDPTRETAVDAAPALDATLDATLDPAPCADLLASIPRAMRGQLDGMALTGHLGGRIRIAVDTAAALGEGAEITNQIAGDCAVLAEPPLADVTSLLKPREHTFPDGSRSAVGPGLGAWVELRLLPAHVDGAFVAAEDARFFEHRGFDVTQIARSLEIDLREGRLARGGSTISQQLIKNVFLDGKRSLARKLTEAILTWRLEARLSKRDILERYLNVIELGPSVYGLAAAAQHWFGVSPHQLSVRQAAFLSALTPEPTTMTRRIVAAGGLDRASATRVDTVLRAMKRQGVIDQAQMELARRADLDFRGAALHPVAAPTGPGAKTAAR
jgi:Transglycosylase